MQRRCKEQLIKKIQGVFQRPESIYNLNTLVDVAPDCRHWATCCELSIMWLWASYLKKPRTEGLRGLLYTPGSSQCTSRIFRCWNGSHMFKPRLLVQWLVFFHALLASCLWKWPVFREDLSLAVVPKGFLCAEGSDWRGDSKAQRSLLQLEKTILYL